MPRPRFDKLAPETRTRILDTAAEGFAESGFEVSYNAIIERTGLSKGVMYYYFDDKEDLYLTVVGDALARLRATVGPWPGAADPPAFWREVHAMYLGMLGFLDAEPRAMALARGFVEAAGSTKLARSRAALRDEASQWIRMVLLDGQRCGAVRADLPLDLMVVSTFGLAAGVDRWVMGHWPLPRDSWDALAEELLGLMRRLLEP